MPLPLPPDVSSLYDFPRRTVEARTDLWRIHRAQRAPAFYGSGSDGRFNPPAGVTSFGTCYTAADFAGAFVEVFGRSPLISTTDLYERAFSVLRFPDDAVFADVTSRTVLGRFGLTSEISAGGPGVYPVTQAWAAALHAAGFDGVAYHVRHDPAGELFGYAAFGEPGEQDKPLHVVGTEAIDPHDEELATMAAWFGYRIVPPLR